ncbi:MAG TPA: hypothetical protein VLC09_14570 [Polyangiaceae bacterium]|nr:hypothetical protein [Polyangiaceae bacterium]
MSRGWEVCLLVLALAGCERAPTREEPEPSQNEPSPNAHILPAPLRGGGARSAADKVTAGAAQERLPWSVDHALVDDEPLVAQPSAFEFTVELQLPELRRAAALGAVAERAKTSLKVQLLPGVSDAAGVRPARQRLVLEGALFVLPEGTELRSRSDRIGALVVWPDGRSYRAVPEGALATLLQERRVDVMPTFEAEVRSFEPITRGERQLAMRKVISPLGELDLYLETVPELGEATQLFCDQLLGLLRAHRSAAACAPGELPIEARFAWPGGGELRATVTTQKRRTDLLGSNWAMPPLMSIWKPGELPPDEERPWPGGVLASTGLASGSATATIENGWDVPMLLFLDGVPLARIEAQGELALAPTRVGLTYQARDFLGRHVRPPAVLQAPARYRLGADPELRPEVSASSSEVEPALR